ncbi:MAG: XrtA system polysaccharide chain length determinant [Candidatus Methylomirabilia bacterium]
MASAELELLKKIGRHAWSRAWWLAGIQIVATAAGITALKVIPKQYESTTTIRMEKSQLINPLIRGLGVSSEMGDRLRGIREEVLSRDYFDKIISRLALEPQNTTPLKHEELVQEMMKHTEITRQREGDTFQVTYRGKDPKEVRDVTNLLAGIFVEDSLSNKAGEAGSAVDFLQSQLEIYRKKLEESEASLRQFTEKNVDQLPSNRAAQLSRIEQLRATLIEVQNTLRQAKMQRDLLRQQALPAGSPLPDGSAAAGAPLVANPLQAQLLERETRLQRLLVDYSEAYPDVSALKAEIAGMRRELEKNPTVPATQASSARQPSVQDALSLGQLQQLEMQVGALAAREQQLAQELALYEKKVKGIPEVEQELARLERDYAVNNDIYNNFLRRLEEAKVSKELEASKKGEIFRILQAAALPLTPSRPKRLPTVLMGVAAGLGLSALLVFLLAQFDTSFQSVDDVQKSLGLKVLAGIPRHRTKKQESQAVLKSVALSVVGFLYTGGVAAFLFWNQVINVIRRGH